MVAGLEAALGRHAARARDAREQPLPPRRAAPRRRPAPAPAAGRRAARSSASVAPRLVGARASKPARSPAASGSGSKAGSPVRSASALCSSAVRVPRVLTSDRKPPWTSAGARPRRGRVAHVLEEALEVVERVGPAVALVGDVALQQRQRHGRAVVAEVLDRAGHRHAVGEVRDLGQEAAHLELGVDAGAQAPVALEEQRLAQRHHGVAALRARAAQTGKRGDVGQRRSRRRRSG